MARSTKSRAMRGGRKDRTARLKAQDWTLGLEVVNPKAGGIDIGNEEHWVAVPPSLDPEPVRKFGCFTADLVNLAEWLVSCGITTVAMQSTGVYWISLHDILSERGIRVCLANAADTKNLPGRKTDIQECQWLLKLHVYGLLQNSFRPEEEICVMRTYWRQRQQHIGEAARCIQRMQKALTQMNLQLANVISDISGETGQAIIGSILAGERDAQTLAKLRDPRIKASRETIAKSLQGNWRAELLFVLKQEFETYAVFQKKIAECDKALYEHFQRMETRADPSELPPCRRDKRPRGNVPSFDLRSELYRITGTDLTAIDGVNVLTAQTVISEVGLDMSRFPTEAQFVSWLGLRPNNKISGGKIVGREKRKPFNRAGSALRHAAGSLLNSESYLGAQYRRLRSKLGAPKARKAMANKLARIIYRMLKFGKSYTDKGQQYYHERHRAQQLQLLTKKAKSLGMQLVACA